MDPFFIVSVYNQDIEGVFAIFKTADFMLTMKKFHLLFFAFVSLFTVYSLSAHCQIPCGIFSDELKFRELEEHVVTIDLLQRPQYLSVEALGICNKLLHEPRTAS